MIPSRKRIRRFRRRRLKRHYRVLKRWVRDNSWHGDRSINLNIEYMYYDNYCLKVAARLLSIKHKQFKYDQCKNILTW